jgi:peptidoglycan/xylan/chitin deacetylase (PgdA/CDA1 family)
MFLALVVVVVLAAVLIVAGSRKETPVKNIATIVEPTPTLETIITPTFVPTPTPDMEKLYGPCTNVKVLMYHHIETEDEAKPKNQGSLSVEPSWFRKDMEYIRAKNYSVIGVNDLINFFDKGIILPKKSVLITLDDAYSDNYTNMWPILKEFGYKATIFVPTGHVNGVDYLSWDQINQMNSLVYFANHTWSHHSSAGSLTVLDKELSSADVDLANHGYNADKVFAYPYGKASVNDEAVLKKYGYKLAFTTVHGTTMCKGKRFDLPRIRIGNAPLSSYGL